MRSSMLKLALLLFGISHMFTAIVPECLDLNEIKKPSDGCDDCETITNHEHTYPNEKPCTPQPIKEPICTCKPGFARKKDPINLLDNGTCVPVEECPKIETTDPVIVPRCPPGQISGLFDGCNTCAQALSKPSCIKKKTMGCHCSKPGTKSNSKKECVPEADCKNDQPSGSEDPQCKENEEKKKAECDDCLTRKKITGQSSKCTVRPVEIGKETCVCKDGFARLESTNSLVKGVCVKIESCPAPKESKCTREEEMKPATCDDCATIVKIDGNSSTCKVPIGAKERCTCKTGFARIGDPNSASKLDRGFCIGIDSCPKSEPKCLENEEMKKAECDDCATRKGELSTCITPLRAKDRCTCKVDFARIGDPNSLTDRGTCVQINKCSAEPKELKCEENEEIKKATNECDDCLTRKKIDKQPSKCTVRPAEIGKEKCVCKDGFARLESTNSLVKGVCVKIESCPAKRQDYDVAETCEKSNEERIKNTGCDNCESRQNGQPSKDCARPEAISCVCKPDFARLNGLCVKKELCPTAVDPIKCPPFEVYGLRDYCDHCYWKQANEKCPYKKATEKGCACPTATHGRRRSSECVPFDKCPPLIRGWLPEPAYYGMDDHV